MRVELRFFATVREAVGARTVEREFAASTTVGDVLGTLEAEFPDLEGRLLEADAIAVTHEAGAGTELADEDRLSITPPVTGG
jgi:molybdopterin synthase sulfur carrier subunit